MVSYFLDDDFSVRYREVINLRHLYKVKSHNCTTINTRKSACIIMTGLSRFVVDSVKSLSMINFVFDVVDLTICISEEPVSDSVHQLLQAELSTWRSLRHFRIVNTSFDMSESAQNSLYNDLNRISTQRPARIFRMYRSLVKAWREMQLHTQEYDVVMRTRTDILHGPELLSRITEYMALTGSHDQEILFSFAHPGNNLVEMSDVFFISSAFTMSKIIDFVDTPSYDIFLEQFRWLLWSPEQIVTKALQAVGLTKTLNIYHVILPGRDIVVYRKKLKEIIDNNLGPWIAHLNSPRDQIVSCNLDGAYKMINTYYMYLLMSKLCARYPLQALILVRILSALGSPFVNASALIAA